MESSAPSFIGNKHMAIRKRKTLKGFSLGEVLLSIAVLTAGILPMLGALVGALNTSLDSQEIVIASGLAQEGAELVLNVRDNGVLAASDAFVAFQPGNRTCRIDYNDAVLSNPAVNDIDCSSPGADGTYYDLLVLGGLYAHDSNAGTSAKFKRRIFINYTAGPGRAAVVSAVYWGSYVPTAANVNTDCTSLNMCVRTSVTLLPWK